MSTILIQLVGKSINGLSYLSKTWAAKKALALFSKPRKGQITDLQARFLETSVKQTLQFKSQQIMTYHWQGTGETILLAHGWESNSGRWKSLIKHLQKKHHTIIALDAPAHGNSGSDRFNAILYSEFIHTVAQHYQPKIIVGHSVGGMASVFFQNKYQIKSIEKLILLGSPSDFKDILRRYTDMLGYNQRVSNQLNTIIKKRFGASPDSFSTAKYIENIHSKGLIIHDEDDLIIPFNDALKINSNFKNSKLIITKGFGHSLNHKKVTQHISDFIEN
jgi:pimeloyl-ACP methyl ester carboxylesterase